MDMYAIKWHVVGQLGEGRAGSKKILTCMLFCKDLENMPCKVVNDHHVANLHDTPHLTFVLRSSMVWPNFLNLEDLKIKSEPIH